MPERRRHPRIVTLRNFGYLALAGVVVLTAFNIRSELGGRRAARDYGRLLDRQMQGEVQQKPLEVVKETSPAIDDQTAPDPMLVEPMRREQWFQADPAEPVQVVEATAQPIVPRAGGDARVAIVGGPDGVAIVQQTRKKPVLAGGFGR